MREDQRPGASVGGVTASDADRGADGVVRYYLVGDSNLQVCVRACVCVRVCVLGRAGGQLVCVWGGEGELVCVHVCVCVCVLG